MANAHSKRNDLKFRSLYGGGAAMDSCIRGSCRDMHRAKKMSVGLELACGKFAAGQSLGGIVAGQVPMRFREVKPARILACCGAHLPSIPAVPLSQLAISKRNLYLGWTWVRLATPRFSGAQSGTQPGYFEAVSWRGFCPQMPGGRELGSGAGGRN